MSFPALTCLSKTANSSYIGAQNLTVLLKMAGQSAAKQDRKIQPTAKCLNLTDYLDRKPGQLSGGQPQHVAIGRTIVRKPAGSLCVEPLSNLYAALNVSMCQNISELHQSLKTTMIHVTHDQV